MLDTVCKKLERGEDVAPELLDKAVDFIRTFADRCHHGKEEDLLFPLMEERGLPKESGPTAVMRTEHEDGRRFVRVMAGAIDRYRGGERGAVGELISNARGYINLLSQHIPKEDNILYPMARQFITPTDERELLEKFEKVEKERIGEGKHEEYACLVEVLEEELGAKA